MQPVSSRPALTVQAPNPMTATSLAARLLPAPSPTPTRTVRSSPRVLSHEAPMVSFLSQVLSDRCGADGDQEYACNATMMRRGLMAEGVLRF